MNNILNTKTDQDKHHRHSIRLKDFDYSRAGAYFVTICVKEKKCVFGNIPKGKIVLSPVGKIAYQCWKQIPKHFNLAKLDIFVVMPNHFHCIIMITDDCRGVQLNAPTVNTSNFYSSISPKQNTLSVIIRTFKAAVTTHCRKNKIHSFQWQRNYYEHVVRNENELNLIRQYILYNPLQWQYDRENPESVPDDNYNNQWGDFEEMLYENKSQDRQDARHTNTKQVSQTFLSDNNTQ